ncbi:MAG: hypothetical protein HOK29_13280 [Candidatus Marinimicrobia bacterium]|jgi:hypothetical protein|nr:hypothetical protein [Candidatus Neomarinimicrobiota bacterium]
MKIEEEINEDIKYYISIRNKAHTERRFRTAEGAQWNIDRCMDQLIKLRNTK